MNEEIVERKIMAKVLSDLLPLCGEFVPVKDLPQFAKRLERIIYKHTQISVFLVRGYRKRDENSPNVPDTSRKENAD